MNKNKMIAWLTARKDILKITAIGRRAGVNKLLDIVNENKDGNGNILTLADHHLPALQKEIDFIRGN